MMHTIFSIALYHISRYNQSQTMNNINPKDNPIQYRKIIRDCIVYEINKMIDNDEDEHTNIVLDLFSEYAQHSLIIYCRRLRASVYRSLKDRFKQLIDRGVTLRVVTESPYSELQAQETAEELVQAKAWRHCGKQQSVPHFAIADGKRVRIEIDRDQSKAIVFPSIGPTLQNTVRSMETFFEALWNESSDDTAAI